MILNSGQFHWRSLAPDGLLHQLWSLLNQITQAYLDVAHTGPSIYGWGFEI